MTELFVNFLAETTLNGAINNSVTALIINAVAASPTTPNVRIRIDDELMLVTAIASTVNYTVTRGIEGTTATSHANGASVRYVLTAAALGGQSDAAAGTPSLRSLGSTATQAAAGIHASTHHSGGADTLTGQSIAGLLTSSTPQFAGLNLGGDVNLIRDLANELTMRNGTNPQTIRLYNTYTDGINFERLNIGWSTNIAFIRTSFAGSGSARSMRFGTGGVDAWELQIAGHLVGVADNSYDIGASNLRARTGYFGTALVLGTNPATTGIIRMANNQTITWRNAANSADVGLIAFDTNNIFYLGTNIAGFPILIYGAETTDPSAPATNVGVMYFRDNGSGKTQLAVRFATGAVQILATEP